MREILPSESKQQSKIRDQSSKFAALAPQISALEEFRQKKGKQVEPSEDEDDSTFAISKEIRSVQDHHF